MRCLATALCLLATVVPAFAQECLPSRALNLPLLALTAGAPENFDLRDLRQAMRDEVSSREDTTHTKFEIKTHLGFAAGYDNNIPHGSIGYYVTVAEWHRWNFGTPSLELGISRYPAVSPRTGESFMKDQFTLLISVASVHYRAGHLRAWGVNWYVNFEQVYDLRTNLPGSQFGISFSRK